MAAISSACSSMSQGWFKTVLMSKASRAGANSARWASSWLAASRPAGRLVGAGPSRARSRMRQSGVTLLRRVPLWVVRRCAFAAGDLAHDGAVQASTSVSRSSRS